MPLCSCGQDYATVELKVEGRVLACEKCAAMLEMVMTLAYGDAKVRRRPVLALVPRGSVDA